MKDKEKTKEQLMKELAALRQRIPELEKSEAKHRKAEEKINANAQELITNEQQLKAFNQQLIASEQQLKASNQQLESNNQQLRASEEKLRVSRERLQFLLSSSSVVFYSSEASGDFGATFISDNIRNQFGYEPEDFTKNPNFWVNHIHPEDRDGVIAGLSDLFEKRFKIHEYRFVLPDGTYRWMRDELKLVLDDDGNPLECVGCWLDITESKRSQQIQKVLYNISNAVSTTENLEGLISLIQKELGTIIDTTNFYVALYEDTSDTFSLPHFKDQKDKLNSFPAGKTLTRYIIKTQKSLLATKQKINKLVKSGDIEVFGTVSKIWLGVPLKVEGKITGVAVQSYTDEFAYDKSDLELLEFMASQIGILIEKKKSEEDLLTALKMAEESDQLKSSFLANMSHEIRTPMNAIIGFSNLIAEAETDEKRDEFIRVVTANGDHLLNIINDIIDISKIETGIITIENQECNINYILDNILDNYKIKDKIKNKEIKISLIKGLSDNNANIISDSTRLNQILINLMENAYKFTLAGKIELGYTLIQDENNGEFLEFFVKDTGEGIEKSKQKMIFERFTQEDSSTTRIIAGTGLGLTISRAIVNVFGGDIWVKSRPGVGSTFYFTIPYKSGYLTDEIYKLPGKKMVDWSTKTILIAEDIDDSYLMIEKILIKYHAKIIRTNDGQETIDICRKDNKIDLILMDIRMPVKNGYDATSEIKEFRPNLPIIAQTAYAIEGDREKALKAGCDDYLSKPINPKLLIKKINFWFAEKK